MKAEKKHGPEWYNCTCPICGKKFHLKKYAVEHRKTKSCCSKECLRKYKHILMSGEGNHQYGIKGKKNATWKSDRKISRYGYIQVRVLDHPFRDRGDFVFEHRLVAEKYLLTDEYAVTIDGKRYLSPKYVVHHKNFDRQDNRPENLMIMTKGEHQRLHTKMNIPKRDKETGRFLKKEKVMRFKRLSFTAKEPTRATDGSVGYDLYADNEETIDIYPHETVMLQTNIAFQFPEGYYGLVYARSGMSTKQGLRPATCVSVIDSDYRGSVGLPMHNDTDDVRQIPPHAKVAQLIIEKYRKCELEEADELDATARGTNGFGSSGE